MDQNDIDMMRGSKSEQDWNDNCAKIKARYGGDYPADWYAKVILSGLALKTRLEHGW